MLAPWVCFGAPATAWAQQTAAAGLAFDVLKIIANQETTGWKIDKYEFEKSMPDVLMSVCQTPPSERLPALAILEADLRRHGGPLTHRAAKSANPQDNGERISADRAARLLAEGLRRAPSECPLTMRPDEDFAGNQTDAKRFTLHAEGGGLFLLQRKGGTTAVGAGGTGRILLGYGFNLRRSLLFGLEFGGNALFQRAGESVNLPLQFTLAAPLVLRHHNVTFQHDLELAPLVYFSDRDTRPSYGVRTGATLGLSTLRIRNIMPWAGITVACEYLFPNAYRPGVSALKAGGRVGFDWDF